MHKALSKGYFKKLIYLCLLNKGSGRGERFMSTKRHRKESSSPNFGRRGLFPSTKVCRPRGQPSQNNSAYLDNANDFQGNESNRAIFRHDDDVLSRSRKASAKRSTPKRHLTKLRQTSSANLIKKASFASESKYADHPLGRLGHNSNDHNKRNASHRSEKRMPKVSSDRHDGISTRVRKGEEKRSSRERKHTKKSSSSHPGARELSSSANVSQMRNKPSLVNFIDVGNRSSSHGNKRSRGKDDASVSDKKGRFKKTSASRNQYENHNLSSNPRKRALTPPSNIRHPSKKPKKVHSGEPGERNNPDGNKRSRKPNPFFRHDDHLSRISIKDSSAIILELLKDRAELSEFLQSNDFKPEAIEKILEILSKLFDTPYTQNFAELLTIFQGTLFVTKHLHRYIMQLSVGMSQKKKQLNHLQRITQFFQELLNRFPDSYEELPLDVLNTCACRFEANNQDNYNSSSSKNINNNDSNDISTYNNNNNNSSEWDEIITSIKRLLQHRDDIIRQKTMLTAPSSTAIPPDDYRNTPIFPTREDIFPDKPPFLRKNIVRGRYDNVNHYLDVQFRLLREDYIAPIRDGVREALRIEGDRSHSIHVYRNVRLTGHSLDSKSGGYLYNLSFDVARMRRVNWEHSKRFKYGSLYCLVDSETQRTMHFVTIAERQVKDLKNGCLKVKFFTDEQPHTVSPQKIFFMIESPAYFESYRYVLEGLQTLNEDNLPFQRYLVECNSNILPPAYLRNARTIPMEIEVHASQQGTFIPDSTDTTEQVQLGCYDLNVALRCAETEIAKSVSVLDDESWPSPSQVDLNVSQLNAVKAALTKEFVIIQGPPGTGKTFVGLRIAKALLTNKKASYQGKCKPAEDSETISTNKRSPILVVCYTNHALDQFLEGLLKVTAKVVRVGGRSKSESLRPFNLQEKKKVSIQSPLWYRLKSELKELRNRIEDETSAMEEAINNPKDEKVLSFLHHEELEQINQWHHAACQSRMSVIQAWLAMKDTFESRRNDYIDYGSYSDSNYGDEVGTTSTSHKDESCMDKCPQVPEACVGNSCKFEKGGREGVQQKVVDDYHAASDLEDGEIVDEFQTSTDILRKATDEETKNEDVMIANVSESPLKRKSPSESNNLAGTPRYVGVSAKKKECILDDLEEGELIDSEEDLLLSHGKLDDGESSEEEDEMMQEPAIDLTVISASEVHNVPSNEQIDQTHQVDLKSLSKDQRSELHQSWVNRYIKFHRDELMHYRDQHDQKSKQISEVESIQIEGILKDVDVIGMTTSGAAKHRRTLQEIKPKIVIVEEAAEVLEGHVLTALSSRTEHLILIGDHKQLKPNPTVYELATKYNLNVSLFERMVANGLTCHSLNTQHRMRPEISDVMRIIYPKLVDHDSVRSYDQIRGIQKSVYFIDHSVPETSNEELKSHSNDHEATFVAALCSYLLKQGYKVTNITVLTMYTGQLLNLRKQMPNSTFEGLRICSVDNFQGEESDIVVLSLVRSNKSGNIGFLNVANRVCVALSRAKKALYCIGNISMMAEKNKLWRTVKAHLEKKSAIGSSLPLYCPNHQDKIVQASSANDFKKAPQGGCLSPCEFRLKCGHVCALLCHPSDRNHENYICEKLCKTELCDLKHLCKRQCHHGVGCGPCRTLVTKVIPSCGHEMQIPCHMSSSKITCKVPCRKELACGHRYKAACGKDCRNVPCTVKLTRTLPCGHEAELMCSDDADKYQCRSPCKQLLDCGHECSGNCHDCHQGTFHVQCKAPCKRVLVCSHECSEPCTRNCPPCGKICENRCYHSSCRNRCGSLCPPCREPCLWKCEHHKCNALCGEMCDRKRCNRRCPEVLPCGHRCVGLCGEVCPKLCRRCDKEKLQTIFLGNEDKPNALYIELVDCGHAFEVSDLDYWMENTNDGENDYEIQLKVCPMCKTTIRRSFRYGNIIKKTLADIEEVKKKKMLEQKRLAQKRLELGEQLKAIRSNYPEESLLDEWRLRWRLNMLGDVDEHNTFENQIKLLPCLYEMRRNFFQGSDNEEFVTRSSKLITEGDGITKLLRDRKILTSQEVSDISDNILFLSLNCRFHYLLWQIEAKVNEEDALDNVESCLESVKKVFAEVSANQRTPTDAERAEITSVIEDVCRKLGVDALTPTERAAERKEIVKAIGLTKGHWFKCRNGHIYAIGECGGAMERGVCPECQEVIGGGNHELAEGNEVAPEMDGAQYAAWSNQANLLNYDQEELRRLQMF